MMLNILRKIIPPFLINWYHFLLAGLAALLYYFPSRKLIVIGITGTKGKSTVVDLTCRILEESGYSAKGDISGKARYKVASLSSIKFKIAEKEWKNTLKMTMPGRLKLQKFLKEAVNANCQYVVLEVTSEGIKQHRHRFIDFDVAVLTNLTPEHIETHGSFENYKKAKGKLFEATKNTHIINLDDENAEYFLEFPADMKIGYQILGDRISGRDPISIVGASNCKSISNGIKFSIKNIEFSLNLLGEFNIYNALAAISIGLSQGISLETSKAALEKTEGIPGRMEIVVSDPFKVIVDYAHTPDSLEKVYENILKSVLRGAASGSKTQDSKLICVLGACGGGRDKWKRPVLGEIAAKYCDEIIVTNEDPYDEDPYQILSMIKSGIFKSQFPIPNFYEILDRREAIKKSLELVKTGDVVIITGKGCEPWMCVAGDKKIPWDDRKIVREEFSKLCSNKI